MINNSDKKLKEWAYQSYYTKNHGDTKYYNFDINPLIHNFSFTEFIKNDCKTEHSAVLIITSNQYVLGYTAEYGIGTHRLTLARIMKDLSGGGYISDLQSIKQLESECTKKFITARIVYDYKKDNEYGRPIYNGAIYFKLPQGNYITKEQFEVFKQFYEDYNKEIETIIKTYGLNKFNIQYEYIDENDTKIMKTVDSLNEVYTYLKTRIDYNKPIYNHNETILGSNLSKHKTRKL